ncbi:MAG: hypothetical protein R3B81_05480 [bacterium]
MTAPESRESFERVVALAETRRNGAPALADVDDLDWCLFHSFPDCELTPKDFARTLPAFTAALEAGVNFDLELLFVRALEIGEAASAESRAALARAALARLAAGALDSSDAIATVRFAIRTVPAGEEPLARLLDTPALEALRWQMSVDYVLDERSLEDYLAMSYLRDTDPDAVRLLERFPIPAAHREQLAAFFADDACRARIAAGFGSFADPAESGLLREGLAERLPGLALGN